MKRKIQLALKLALLLFFLPFRLSELFDAFLLLHSAW
jgi:hypothetical protein